MSDELRDRIDDAITDYYRAGGPSEVGDLADYIARALGLRHLRAQPYDDYVLQDDEYHDRLHETDQDCDSDREPCLHVWIADPDVAPDA